MADRGQEILDALVALSQKTGLPDMGRYWSQDNARFDALHPSLMDKIIRNVNPMTAFGSAIGQMQDAASQGDKTAMALSALGAMPAWGAAGRTATIYDKFGARSVANSGLLQTLKNIGANTGQQLALDRLQQ